MEDQVHHRKRSRTNQGSAVAGANSQPKPPPASRKVEAPRVFTQYTGDYSGCTRNTQVLFAQQTASQSSHMDVA